MPPVLKTQKDFEDFIATTVAEKLTAALAPLQQRQGEWAQRMFGTGEAEANEHQAQEWLKHTGDWSLEAYNPYLVRGTRAEANSLLVARFARAIAGSRKEMLPPPQWAQKYFGADDPVTKALAAGDASSGGFLIPPSFSSDFIEFLRPRSIIRTLNPIILPMQTGTITIPKLAGGASAAYIGENKAAVLTQQQFGDLTLSRKKLAALVPISNDLLRYASPAADVIVRDDMVSAMAQRQDKAFIRDDGTQYTPKGIRNWIPASNVLTANATESQQNTTNDMSNLVVALKGKNVRMIRPGWMMSVRSEQYLMSKQTATGQYVWREEMLGGKLNGWPYGVTTQIPENLGAGHETEFYLVDFADFVIGESLQLLVDVSMEAAYEDGNGNVIAAFSRDQTVVRTIQEHDCGMRHDFSAAVLTGVTWGYTP
jgi:HK97 family phage major capsid protein